MVLFPEKGNIGRGRIGLEGERMSLVLNEFAVGVELSSSHSDMCQRGLMSGPQHRL